MLVWRGRGGLIPLLLLIPASVIVYLRLTDIITGSNSFLFGVLFISAGIVSWIVGRPLNRALEEKYGQAGKKFRLRDIFEIDKDAWMRPAEPSHGGAFGLHFEVTKTPFHSFMFIKMEYWAFLLAFAAAIAFVWDFLPEF